MRRHLTLLAVFAATLLAPASAHAYVLGAADGSTDAAPIAQQLGARTYRVVMDSSVPLDTYAPRIETYRAFGMHPQIVVDGTGTAVRGKHGKNWQTINYAIHAFKRWPDIYSVSVMNEPNISGISACQYEKTFRRAYKMLKAAGVPRVLFGEFSPGEKPNALDWTAAILACAKKDIIADGWAWHCYDSYPGWFGIGNAQLVVSRLRALRHLMHTRRGAALPIYCTEYGVPTPGRYLYSGQDGDAYWARALGLVRRFHLAEIVAWGITEEDAGHWDMSLVRRDGSPRPAFATIAGASHE